MVDSTCQLHKEILLSCCRSSTKTIRSQVPLSTLARSTIRIVQLLIYPGHPCKLNVDYGRGKLPELRSDAFYLLPSQSSDNLERHGRLVHAHWIDSSLFRRWKTQCDRCHPDCTRSSMVPRVLAHIHPLWLVDISRRCLVPAQPSYSYVCLSYVWGGSNQFTTQLNIIGKLQQPNSLSSVPLAKTIVHAMAVAEMAGERYLWVDALCIVQDDNRQKEQDIQNMSGIYANASFTIIAQSATHADSGLCGLFGISRKREIFQTAWRLGPSATIVHTSDKRRGNGSEDEGELSSCPTGSWNTRGWTFQERLFSRRQLVFAENGPTQWNCLSNEWQENIEMPKTTTRVRTTYRINEFNAQFHDVRPAMRELRSTIKEYNTRDFTLPEDSLRAFSGIATALLSSFHAGFISGLPRDFFHIALLWRPSFGWDFRLRWPGGISTKCQLPSWCWAAWQGKLNLKSWGAANTYSLWSSLMPMERVFPLVVWRYHTTTEDPGVVIEERFDALREQYFNSNSVQCPPGWSRDQVREKPVPHIPDWIYSYHNGPKSLERLAHPIPVKSKHDPEVPGMIIAPWISCNTQSAVLVAAERIEHTMEHIYLRDLEGTWAGELALNPNPLLPSERLTFSWVRSLEGMRLTLVAVALVAFHETDMRYPILMRELEHPERPRGTPSYEYYYVMWVEWKDGIAYRRGLGTVAKSIWEAQDRQDIHLMLG
ncbi:heterokaryon incompatibility protein-domain-containing protein [Apiosordaria backusii]|uniref:Heterokaryon incompatibility protein-domain-containing protein n=1 Tax=Apiosordaria backusii TaxID=314023 RepID=A0AA40K169_9PEZI|nr:heterokaryon incompatibility protein-domain-containing protein [Apiosordaria backusii]